RQLYREYTAANSYIPSDDEYISSVAAAVVGNIRNPYEKASQLYSYIIRRLEYNAEAEPESLADVLRNRQARARDYGLLLTTMLRAVGVPARPVSGFLVHGNKRSTGHLWSEFYLPEFGWVPADPALGSGSGMYELEQENPFDFYFGNLDNQHISFSRHVRRIPKVDPSSLTRVIDEPYALQNIFEEYSPEMEGYRSHWPDIRVVDWW
ncbi:MAG TPA: transglutaminase domain-containing protein, partial [Sediminispirochaeta sp.]|nr:transglutaminase domain-containing protein [Sediminispirochaeta sp.]